MNVIDILVGILLIWAIWKGWKNGILTQLSAIVGILVGTWAAFHFSELICNALNVSLQFKWLMFITIIIAVIIAVLIVSRLITRLLSMAGASVVISLLGAVASVLKVVIILALLFRIFDNINHKASLTDDNYLQQSISYAPIDAVANVIFPYLNDWLSD